MLWTSCRNRKKYLNRYMQRCLAWQIRESFRSWLLACARKLLLLSAPTSSSTLASTHLRSPSESQKEAGQFPIELLYLCNVSNCLATERKSGHRCLCQLQSLSGQSNIFNRLYGSTKHLQIFIGHLNRLPRSAMSADHIETRPAPPQLSLDQSAAMPTRKPLLPKFPPSSSSASVVYKRSPPLPRLDVFSQSGT